MTVYCVSASGTSALGAVGTMASSIERLSLSSIKTLKPAQGDIVYLDVTSLDDTARSKAIAALKRRCGTVAWGVADPEGGVSDPAGLFFAGASDYLGPATLAAGLTRARLKAALTYAAARSGAESAACDPEPATKKHEPEFPGWKSIRPGSVYPFYFLYVGVSAQMNLKTRLGERGYVALKDGLRTLVQQGLANVDPVLWMETDASSLYLIPPRAFNARAAVVACQKMLLWTPLLGYEKLGLPFPLSFTFALHYGNTEFAVPGKTGTIVSDAVNYIFHLGAKRAEAGCLTVSADAATDAIPDRFSDLFVSAGSYEDRAIVRSKRYIMR